MIGAFENICAGFVAGQLFREVRMNDKSLLSLAQPHPDDEHDHQNQSSAEDHQHQRT